MDNDKLEPTSSANEAEGASGCGPGCSCGGTKIGKKGKVIICLVVLIAASAVLANSMIHKTETGVGQGQNSFATPVLLAEKASPTATAGKVNETNQTNSSLWEKPLQSLDSLNDMASQKDAVFLYLPVKGQRPDERAKKEIERATGKAQSQEIKMALFTLDEGSKDYAQVTSQVPAPCVLAMVKGVGTSVAATNISEENLLQALVSASRPSGCSPGGCAQPC
jgi:hypothetical protein